MKIKPIYLHMITLSSPISTPVQLGAFSDTLSTNECQELIGRWHLKLDQPLTSHSLLLDGSSITPSKLRQTLRDRLQREKGIVYSERIDSLPCSPQLSSHKQTERTLSTSASKHCILAASTMILSTPRELSLTFPKGLFVISMHTT